MLNYSRCLCRNIVVIRFYWIWPAAYSKSKTIWNVWSRKFWPKQENCWNANGAPCFCSIWTAANRWVVWGVICGGICMDSISDIRIIWSGWQQWRGVFVLHFSILINFELTVHFVCYDWEAIRLSNEQYLNSNFLRDQVLLTNLMVICTT